MDSFLTDLKAAHFRTVRSYVVNGGIMFGLNSWFLTLLLLTLSKQSASSSEFFTNAFLFVPMMAMFAYNEGLRLAFGLRQCFLRRALKALDGTLPVHQVHSSLDDCERAPSRGYGTITIYFYDGTPERFDVPVDRLDAIARWLRSSYRFESYRTSVTRPWWILQNEV